MKVQTVTLAEAASKLEASARRAAEATKNPIIKECHIKQATEALQLLTYLQTMPSEVNITADGAIIKK